MTEDSNSGCLAQANIQVISHQHGLGKRMHEK